MNEENELCGVSCAASDSSEKHLTDWMKRSICNLAHAEVEVPRRYSLYTDRNTQYPRQCFEEAYRYVDMHRIRGMTYVFGTAVCGGMQQHAWVELPENIVFDGTLQRFYDRDKYYDSECAMPWYRFTRSAVRWIVDQRFTTWRWDMHLRLPWAKSAMDSSAEVLLVNRDDARTYFEEKQREAAVT